MSPLVWCLLLISINTGSGSMECPTTDVHFEKVIGLRPTSNTSQQMLLYKPRGNAADEPVTLDCIASCSSKEICQSFVLYYDTAECYWFEHGPEENASSNVTDLDNNVAWFVKTCFKIDKPCNKSWIFERIPGATLIGNDTKILPGKTRKECQQGCLEETSFQCRSVKFKIDDNEVVPSAQLRGTCILSNADRHLLPTSYRISTFDDEYFENQCTDFLDTNNTNKATRNEFCAYEEYDNVILDHSDVMFRDKTKEECQNLCDQSSSFNCRSFSVINGNTNRCLLHSEDSKIHGPKLLKSHDHSKYYERARCLNINVSCSESYVTVKYSPEIDFRGKIYMQGYSENGECYAVGQGKQTVVTLKLSFLTSQCGIIKADSPYNRSLPNKGSTLLNTSSNETVSPVVEMKVVDLSTQQETTDTQIGQELQLQIELKEKTNEYDLWASHLIAMTEKGDESIFLVDDRGCPTNLKIFPPLKKVVENGKRRLESTFQAFKFASSPIVRFSVIIQFCPKECPQIQCDDAGRKKREMKGHLFYGVNRNASIKTNFTDSENNSAIVNQMPLEYVMLVRDPNTHSDRLIVGDNKLLVAGFNYDTNEVCMDYSLVVGLTVTWILVQLIFIICCLALVRRYRKHYQDEYLRASMEEIHKNFGLGFNNLENRRVRWADNGDVNVM
ncbi:uncharacterized protein LOC132703587 isoform X2 [Cylas formicarius]|uniref:uncharacterized protein LOC132703587 isoform X2 n=1 Tax=Cylas formicarius TaxID=197179 RepID=UPI002958AEEC|nr:uncharacterized protein LOC132703587 isoform X2 [Cylas formicarius]